MYLQAAATAKYIKKGEKYIMFSNKEINTFIGMFYAASHSSSANPVQYHEEFINALNTYFTCYPNDDENEDIYTSGDFPFKE